MNEKPPENNTTSFSHLTVEDLRAIQVIQRGNEWLRAILCTLARRGAAFRKLFPERAKEILMILTPLPYYKAGQFLFDLMEWEDFMVDGPPPPVLTTALDARALKRLASLLNTIQATLDGSQSQTSPPDLFGQLLQVEISSLVVDDRQLPPLEAGFYLYQDVVLGLYTSALQNGQSLSSLMINENPSPPSDPT
jgi:hypothetical protein